MASHDHIAQLTKRIWREKSPLSKQRKRQGLCKLPADAIVKARDDTAAQANRILLTFVGAVVFCVLCLLTPDSALLAGGEKLNVPLAGPVSFFGFMLLGPSVLFFLRAYLQIYVDHQRRLDRITQLIPAARRTSILTPDQNPLIRGFRVFVLYLLLPLAMLAFWWKAAVFAEWRVIFPIFVAVVSVDSLIRLFPWLSQSLRVAIILGVAILAAAVTLSFGSFKRPLSLFQANLADQWLVGKDLEAAFLIKANLERATLYDANLRNANLSDANLAGTDLRNADLTGADLYGANLTGAKLTGANLTGADLSYAKLTSADVNRANLTRAKLISSDLNRASFGAAKLNGAIFVLADLTGAHFIGAKLTGANFRGAKLTSAIFVFADLTSADFLDANLANANLVGANLIGAMLLTQQQLDATCGDAETRLPPGLSVKFCGQR